MLTLGKTMFNQINSTLLGITPAFALHQLLKSAFSFIAKHDPITATKLRAFDDFTIKIINTSPAFNYFVTFNEGNVYRLNEYNGEVCTTMRGAASDFMMLTTEMINQSTEVFNDAHHLVDDEDFLQAVKGQIIVSGDTDRLNALLLLVKESDPDWETPLANHTHPLLAYGFKKGVSKIAQYLSRSTQHAKLAITEYLQEESAMLVSTYPFQSLQDEVRDLQTHLATLEKQVNRMTDYTCHHH